MVILPRPWKTLLLFGATGTLLFFCWWQVRLLGDIRSRLGVFYGWFALAFALYLVTLWLIHDAERSRVLPRNFFPATGPAAAPPFVRPRPATIALVLRADEGDPAPRHPWPIRAVFDGADTSPFFLLIILIGAVAFRLCLLGTTPTLSDDIYRYQWDGRVQRAGIDPYVYPPNAPQVAFLRDETFTRINFPHLRTVYPPLTEHAFRLSLFLGSTLTAQKIVFVGAELMTAMSLLFILWRRGQSLLWVAAYAWHPLVILEVAGSGHNDALGVALLWLGVAAWHVDNYAGSALAWAGAFASKFGSIIMAPWWYFRRTARLWLALCAVFAAVPLACCPTVIGALIESLSAMTARFESNSSLYFLAARLLGHPGVARVLVTSSWVVFLFWWARRQEDPVRYLLGGFTAAALLSPVLHPWYLLWIIPCFCFVRVPAIMVLTGTVVLMYTVWPGRLTDGRWIIPLWAHLLEYVPVFMLGGWEVMKRCGWGSSFRLAMKPGQLAKS